MILPMTAVANIEFWRKHDGSLVMWASRALAPNVAPPSMAAADPWRGYR